MAEPWGVGVGERRGSGVAGWRGGEAAKGGVAKWRGGVVAGLRSGEVACWRRGLCGWECVVAVGLERGQGQELRSSGSKACEGTWRYGQMRSQASPSAALTMDAALR